MKKQTRLIAAAAVGALALSAFTNIAKAFDYTPVAGTETTFDKYLILDKDAHVPAAEFSFTIEPGTAIAATETGMQVLAGPAGAAVTNTAVFSPDDEAYGTLQEGDSFTLAEGEKYAFKTVTVDFSNVTFDEPGIYRYTVTEEASASAGAVTQDPQAKTLDVYVTDSQGALIVSSYVLHSGTAAPVRNEHGGSQDVAADGTALTDKVTGFINRYTTRDLTITKQVAGSQASRDKYFLYTLSIANAGAGTKLSVDVTANADSAPNKTSATVYDNDTMKAANGTTELVCSAEGTVSQNFYLKHNQSITIRQLPYGASYELTEAAEDYVSADLHNVDEETYASVTGTIGMDDLTAGFRNTRDGIIPTGIVFSTMPYAMLMIIGAAGYCMMGSGRRFR